MTCHNESVRQWLVGGGIIEGSLLEGRDGFPEGSGWSDRQCEGLLLVQNTRRGGVVDWTPPGGVIDHGEPMLEGLTREVKEETGLSVIEWSGPIYVISAEAPGLEWHLRVEVHRAAKVTGTLQVGKDPDGIVTHADLVSVDDCEDRLRGTHPWVREPLMHWLTEPWEDTRRYEYLVEGTDLANLQVTSTHSHEA